EGCERPALGCGAEDPARVVRLTPRGDGVSGRRVALDVPLALPQRRRIQRMVARAHFEEQQDVFAGAELRLIEDDELVAVPGSAELLDDDLALGDVALEDAVDGDGDVGVDAAGRDVAADGDVGDAARYNRRREARQVVV